MPLYITYCPYCLLRQPILMQDLFHFKVFVLRASHSKDDFWIAPIRERYYKNHDSIECKVSKWQSKLV